MFDMRESEFTTHVEPLVKFSRKFTSNPIEFVIETELSHAEVVRRLQGVVAPRNPIIAPLVPTNRLFAGRVSNQGFQIMRIIGYGTGSLPVIVGRFEPGSNGARIHVTMRLSRLASVFRSLLLFVLTIIMVCSSIAVWKKSDAAAVLLPLGIVLGFVYFMSGRDSQEGRRARTLLEETLQTTPSVRVQQILSGVAPRRLPGLIFVLGVGLILYELIGRIGSALFSRS